MFGNEHNRIIARIISYCLQARLYKILALAAALFRKKGIIPCMRKKLGLESQKWDIIYLLMKCVKKCRKLKTLLQTTVNCFFAMLHY